MLLARLAHLNLFGLTVTVAPLLAAACDPSDSSDFSPDPPVKGPATLAEPQGDLCSDVPEVDLRRSMVLSELEVVAPFTFARVMQQIVDTSGVQGLNKTQLYQRWWDFFNNAPGLHPEAFHCDDHTIDGQPALGAFPHSCPRPEGFLAGTDPFVDPEFNPDSYIAIGVFNRIDLAPLDGSSCGEARIIFAKMSGQFDPNNRNLIIFEGRVPNPSPACGIDGCRPIAQFWADLSEIDDILEIRDRVENFFFVDAAGAGPIVHADNYGPKGGQIRTNQFMNGPNNWELREFVFDHDCGSFACIKPRLLLDNPFPDLFADPSPNPAAKAFQDWFVTQVPNLEQGNSNTFFFRDVGTFKSGASHSQEEFDDYLTQAGFDSPFLDRVQAAITNPEVTAPQLVNRALALSCAGCHEHNNTPEGSDLGDGLDWQPSLGFIHNSETFLVEGPFGTRFPLSDAVRFVFLPHRAQVMTDFLKKVNCAPCNKAKAQQFGPPDATKHLLPGFDAVDGMQLGGPRMGH